MGFLDFLASTNILSRSRLEFVLEGKYDIAEVGTKFYCRDFDKMQADFLEERTKIQTYLNKLANVDIKEKNETKSAEVDKSKYQPLLKNWGKIPIQSKKTKRIKSNEQIFTTTRGVNTASDGDVATTSATTTRESAKRARENETQNPIQFNYTTVKPSPFSHF